MPRALNLLRAALHYRRESFDAGLRAAGFEVVQSLDKPKPGDLLVTWNSYGGFDEVARRFKAAGAMHLVAENGPLSKTWRGGEWFSLALDTVALTGGEFRPGGHERWDSWGVDLGSWHGGRETIILAQRGIGHPDVRSPDRWAESVKGRFGGRIRQHPGTGRDYMPLDVDLMDAAQVITWSSAAAAQALAMGVPVWHAHPRFMGAAAARPLSEWPGDPKRDDASRLEFFRRLAWAMWNLDEIRTGEPIARLTIRP